MRFLKRKIRRECAYSTLTHSRQHLETPHFKKYAETTKDMVKSRKRIDNVPITLNVKGK